MLMIVIIVLLAFSSPAMVACQIEDWAEDAAIEPQALTTLAAWGNNLSGELGYGASGRDNNPEEDMRSLTPVEVANLTGVQEIAAGGSHSLALKDDGTVWAWGLNQFGELGNGTTGVPNSSSTPVQVKDPHDPSGYLSGVKAIAAGSAHGLALKDDGTVWAWGSNQSGQLGNGTNT